jgi:hypothetical protein
VGRLSTTIRFIRIAGGSLAELQTQLMLARDDPIGYAGGLNIYAYVGRNPVGWIDPWGTDGEPWYKSLVPKSGGVLAGANGYIGFNPITPGVGGQAEAGVGLFPTGVGGCATANYTTGVYAPSEYPSASPGAVFGGCGGGGGQIWFSNADNAKELIDSTCSLTLDGGFSYKYGLGLSLKFDTGVYSVSIGAGPWTQDYGAGYGFSAYGEGVGVGTDTLGWKQIKSWAKDVGSTFLKTLINGIPLVGF